MTTSSVFSRNGEEVQAIQRPIVLAIDDDEDNLLLIRFTLELYGCEFLGDASGEAMLSLAREHQPDLILLDILLPTLNGFDLIKLLKQDLLTCDIPVVAVTGLAGEDDRRQLLQAGFVGYMIKPYLPEDLESIVRQYSRCPLAANLSVD
ncbi:MAG: response regulator [Cyanobacteria bacterium CRU_2_1]|nr:response regulator [Cyanobacteria bacterium RU_5_0]NJR61077.1 response regulator [Cyanobacteria bacterium CRU_2_1]